MSLHEKFFECGAVTNLDQAIALVRSKDSNNVCRGISQISVLFMNSLLPHDGRDSLILSAIRSLEEKQQRMVAGATIMAFRLNKELPGLLEHWAINKLPEFNWRTLKALEDRSGFLRPPTQH